MSSNTSRRARPQGRVRRFALALAALALAWATATPTTAADTPPLLDSDSITCLECHPGNGSAPAAPATALRGRAAGAAAARANHPIGVRYADATSFGGYRPVATLPAAIRLPDGRLGCTSCHLPEGGRHGELALANTRSALCVACHDK